jgi:hypothetical protein
MATSKTAKSLISVAAPNLPVAPNEYKSEHHDIVNNVLRLYFNRISSNIITLSTPSSGTTADRPAPANRLLVGQFYFDTTVGKPIWWNGTNWIDAAGTVV